MYKVSEVAEMLSIEKVKIFEVMIVHAETLAPYTQKERHLSYITEEGVRLIENIIYGNEEEIVETVEEEDVLEYIMEEDQLDLFIKRNEEKKSQLKNEIIDLKRQINLLDKDMRSKSEAILNYQEIIAEDLVWLVKLEEKLDTYREIDLEEKKTGFFNRLRK